MRTPFIACVVWLLAFAHGAGLAYAQTDTSAAHVAHVMASFKDTPSQQGLLPTAIAEARIAVQHASLAAKSADKLEAMKLHAGHVIHAIDPHVEPKGPGLGYGVKKAAAAVAEHAELAGAAPDATDNVKKRALYATTWANNVVRWSDEVIDIAQRMRAATTVAAAAALTADLTEWTTKLIDGIPAIGRDGIQGGLLQAQEHMEKMKEGL